MKTALIFRGGSLYQDEIPKNYKDKTSEDPRKHLPVFGPFLNAEQPEDFQGELKQMGLKWELRQRKVDSERYLLVRDNNLYGWPAPPNTLLKISSTNELCTGGKIFIHRDTIVERKFYSTHKPNILVGEELLLCPIYIRGGTFVISEGK